VLNMTIAGLVLAVILGVAKFAKGFVANIAVLIGIVAGGVIAALMGLMNFEKVANAGWFALVTPFSFGTPTFDAVMIVTMCLVMIVVMIVVVIFDFFAGVQRVPTGCIQQADPCCIRGECLERFFQPRCQTNAYPNNQFCISKPSCIARSQRKIMRVRTRWQQ